MGDDELIKTFFAPLAAANPGAFGLTDDCAALTPEPGEDLVLTMDAVAEGVHFLPDDMPADIAWKALAVNVSDLVSKGARPVGYLLALSLPDAPPRAWLEGFSAGLAEAQGAFGISLLGGDTDRRAGAPLSATVTAIGAVPKGRMVRRGTARAGDALFVSGSIGDSALGLIVRREPARSRGLGLDAAAAHYLTGRYVRPAPRVGLAPVLLELATAAMDVSDGLAMDCGRLARASGLAASVDGHRLPFSPAFRMALSRDPALFNIAVSGGDDYEVLAAVAPDRADAFRRAAVDAGVPVTEIGRLYAGSGLTLTGLDGSPVAVGAGGWEHFSSS